MSLSTIAAPRQKLIKESATVVATTTFDVVVDRPAFDGPSKEFVDIDEEFGNTPLSRYSRHRLESNVSARDLALNIINVLQGAGHLAYWVGGCVRDLILEREPSDFDIATAATPPQILALFPHSKLVGASFGVVLVTDPQSGENIEVATFRSESAYHDGRHPSEVRYETDPRLDASRRDFTINSLFLDPVTNTLLDHFGGQADLQAGILRAIGEPRRRFEEDHLRLLRAVRFAARFGFQIEPQTFAAIQELAPKIKLISAERIRDELTRTLTEGGPGRGLRLLDSTSLIAHVLPEVKDLQGVEQPPEHHPEGDVWNHTLLMLDLLHPPVPTTLAWGVLLHDIGKPATQTITDRIRFNGHVEAGLRIAAPILDRLRFSSDDKAQILALVENHMRFMEVRAMRESTRKRFLRLPAFDEHLELHRVDCMSSNRRTENYEFVQEQLATLPPESLRPAPLLTGADLIAAGLAPGPRFRELLTQIQDAQLEGRIQTQEEASALLQTLLNG
jgi:tRNA nucleotidyltransferase/poly(A) polymerase